MADDRKQRLANRDRTVPCFVCLQEEPLLTAHDHHRKPRAFGGSDDATNRVWLCASCHTRLHRVQEFLVQGKAASAYELTASIFPTNAKARGQLWVLANEAAEAEREVGEAFTLHRTTTKVNLEVDTDVWAAVKAAAKDHKVSAKALASQILTQYVKGT